MNEADTCRTLITPKLQAVGWDTDPHSIAEQRCFTAGRIVVQGGRATRRKAKRADYLLRYTRDFPIAVVEAKSDEEQAAIRCRFLHFSFLSLRRWGSTRRWWRRRRGRWR